MNTEMMLEQFREMLVLEERARHFYDHYIDCLDEGDIKEQLTSIRNDEIKHIEVVKKLIGYVS